MTSVSWKNNADGNWSIAANWSTGVVPGAADDVTISVSSAHTITHGSGNDKIASLYTSNLATLGISGGTLNVLGNTTLYGAVTQSGAVFDVGPGGYSGGTYTQSAGTLRVSSGTFRLDGTGDSFAGTLTGAGIDFESGTDLLAAGLTLSVGRILVSGATITLGQSFAQAGPFEMSSGTLALGGNTLTLGAAAALDGGATSGAGTLAVQGNTTISAFYLTGSNVLDNTGTLTASSYFYVGYYGPDTTQLINEAAGTLRLLGNTTVYGAANSLLTNAGLLVKAGGSATSSVNVVAKSTGTVSVASGTLAFNGVGDSFAGTLAGGGTTAFGGGSDLLANGLALSVGNVVLGGASVTLGGNLTDAGGWTQTSGTLALGGYKLSLSGQTALDGGYILGAGTLAVSGTTELSGSELSGSVSLVNTGSVVQDATFYDGYSGPDTNKIINQAGAAYDIAGNLFIYGATGAGFTNAGSLLKSGGSGIAGIGVSLTSTGTITVSQGTLRLSGTNNALSGTIGGAGTLEFNAGATSLGKLTLTVGHMLLDGAVATLGANLKYAGDYTQTAGTLALGGRTLSLTSGSLEGGFTSGSGTIAVSKSLDLSGSALSGSAVLTNAGTITASGGSYIGYYSGDTAQLVNKAGATLLLNANATLYGVVGSTLTNAGTLIKASGGGTSLIADSVASTGTITVNSGVLRLDGPANNFAGAINGAGTLELSSGSDSLAGSTTLGVGRLLLDGANLTLVGSVASAAQFVQTYGTLALGGQTLSLSGAATFEGGAVTGSGTIAASGDVKSYGLALEGSTVFTNAGTLTDTNIIYNGYNASDTAQLINLAGGTVKLLDGTSIYGGGAGSFANAGTVLKLGGGTVGIGSVFSSTGTVTIAQGTLRLSGSASTLGGVVQGAGTLELSSTTALKTSSLTAGGVLLDGGVATLGAALSYAGDWSQTYGTLALGGQTLTLSGTASLDGGNTAGSGKIVCTGTAEVGNWALEGSTVLQNSGNLTVVANGDLYAGYNASDTATITNLAGGHIDLLANARIGSNGTGVLTNAGTLSAEGAGAKYVYPATVNTGAVIVSQDSLTFLGAVSGSGSFAIGTGAQLAFSAAVTGAGTVTLGADATLGVSTTAGFSDQIGGFAAGDLIDLNGFSFNTSAPPSLSFNAATDKLTVTEGSTSFTLSFTGAHAAADFLAINDHGVIGIVHS